MKCENYVTHMLGFPELFTTIIKTPNKGMLFWRHDVSTRRALDSLPAH